TEHRHVQVHQWRLAPKTQVLVGGTLAPPTWSADRWRGIGQPRGDKNNRGRQISPPLLCQKRDSWRALSTTATHPMESSTTVGYSRGRSGASGKGNGPCRNHALLLSK